MLWHMLAPDPKRHLSDAIKGALVAEANHLGYNLKFATNKSTQLIQTLDLYSHQHPPTSASINPFLLPAILPEDMGNTHVHIKKYYTVFVV